MYYVLNADSLLAAVLSSRECISIYDLNEIRRDIEDRCPGVAVDISSPAILGAIESYPEIFERQDDRVVRARNAQRYLGTDYLKYTFTNHIPDKVRVVLSIG